MESRTYLQSCPLVELQDRQVISILIPVCNEEDILEGSIRRLHDFMVEHDLEHEIIVVSNGSTDATNDLGEALAAQNKWLSFFVLPERGVGLAFVKAVREARSEHLVSLDIDLSFDLAFVQYAHDLLQYGDIVVGSKTMGRQRRSLMRVVASQVYIAIAQLTFGLTISDYSIGCKAYRRSAIEPALKNLDPWTGFVLELCLYANAHGRKIIQIGVNCNDRRRSHFNLLHEGIYRFHHLWKCWRRTRG